ncbi:unnamed protein product, partial [Laminaria digitata]
SAGKIASHKVWEYRIVAVCGVVPVAAVVQFFLPAHADTIPTVYPHHNGVHRPSYRTGDQLMPLLPSTFSADLSLFLPPPLSCGRAKESRTHIVGEYEMYKEERDVLE